MKNNKNISFIKSSRIIFGISIVIYAVRRSLKTKLSTNLKAFHPYFLELLAEFYILIELKSLSDDSIVFTTILEKHKQKQYF